MKYNILQEVEGHFLLTDEIVDGLDVTVRLEELHAGGGCWAAQAVQSSEQVEKQRPRRRGANSDSVTP